MSKRIKSFEDLKKVELKHICAEVKVVGVQLVFTPGIYVQTTESEEIVKLENYCPKVTAFGLNTHHMLSMKELKYYTVDGDSFTQLLDKKGQIMEKKKGSKLSVDEVFKEVWEPTKKFWTELCAELEEGEIYLSKFKRHFQTDNIVRLKQELKKHSGGNFIDWIDHRIHQFEQYRTICNCSKGAEAIMKVVNVYGLKGNFNQIKETLQLVSMRI